MQYTLSGTLAEVLRICEGLDREKADRRHSAEAWSVSEIVEHLAIVERGASVGIRRALTQEAAEAAALEQTKNKSELISNRVGMAVARIEAPESVRPSGKFGEWPRALEMLVETRRKLIEMEASGTAGFDTHVMAHPILGPMTVRQWFQFLAAHTNRHLKQIEGVLAEG